MEPESTPTHLRMVRSLPKKPLRCVYINLRLMYATTVTDQRTVHLINAHRGPAVCQALGLAGAADTDTPSSKANMGRPQW